MFLHLPLCKRADCKKLLFFSLLETIMVQGNQREDNKSGPKKSKQREIK